MFTALIRIKFTKKCSHTSLTDRAKKWLKSQSSVYLAFNNVISNIKPISDIRMLANFCHTVLLESFHSLI